MVDCGHNNVLKMLGSDQNNVRGMLHYDWNNLLQMLHSDQNTVWEMPDYIQNNVPEVVHIRYTWVGILANKWRIFHRPLNVDPTLAEDIVKVCCVFHNFVRDRDGVQIEDTLTVDGLFEMDSASGPTPRLASNLRDKFADYFMSEEGAVPWQRDRMKT